MKRLYILKRGFLLTILAVAISGCVENEFDSIDLDKKNTNPLEGVLVPDGFISSTTSNIMVNVNVNDKFDGKYDYLVEIFTSNPISASKVNAIAAGVVKGNDIFSTEITIPTAQTYFFVRQTDPKGIISVKEYSVGKTVNCDFNSARTSSNAISTRVFAPLKSSSSVPYTEVPTGAIEIRNITTPSLQNSTNYVISSNYTGTFVHWGTTGTKLFVNATWTIPSDFKIENGLEVIVMNGGKIVNSNKIELVGNETKILVMQGGEVSLNTLNLSNKNEIYNLGKFSATTIIDNPGNFYNGPSGIFSTTNLQAGGGEYINDGIMNFEKFETTWGCKLQNNCTMNISSSFIFKEGAINQSKGSIIAETMEFNNSTINLVNASMLKSSTNIKFNSKTVINASGASSLVKSPEMTCSNELLFKGNLVVEVNSISEASQWWSPWRLESPAQMTTYNGSSLSIETCTGTVNNGNPGTDPQDPEYPIVVEDETKYTYIFEDGWPLYGDYDMNDMVLRVNSKSIKIDKNNKVLSFSMEVEMLAVGATKNIAAALQLDNILASDITESVTYTNKPQDLFSYSSKNIEADQKYAVLPLFSNAHEAFGLSTKDMINTHKTGSSNISNTPKYSFTINLPVGKYAASDFINSKVNFFIITNNKNTNRIEVHLPGFKPTDLVDNRYFGNNNDATSATEGKYYISQENLAWAIMVPQSFRYPLENVNMSDAYKNFTNWLSTGGSEDSNWFEVFEESKVF